ncbi:MAG: hypothetical protein ACK47B_21665 [Armatimonadota bacterium]
MKLLRSRKLRALQLAYGKPWWQVAIDAAASAELQADVADRWTMAAQTIAPGVQYSKHDVCKFIRRAVEMQQQRDPESVRHLLDDTRVAA